MSMEMIIEYTQILRNVFECPTELQDNKSCLIYEYLPKASE